MLRIIGKYIESVKTIAEVARASMQRPTGMNRITRLMSIYEHQGMSSLEDMELLTREVAKLEHNLEQMRPISRKLEDLEEDRSISGGKPICRQLLKAGGDWMPFCL